MKEKIGIEKLYELLFEYSEDKSYYWALTQSGKIEGDVGGTDHTLEGEEVLMVIKSKEFGFIKWLVENDKIDKEFEDNKMLGDIFDSGYRFNDDYIEERLLCYLALSDEPIRFLCEILK